MNYYSFHIGDYLKQTAHLTPLEDICYRRLIDMYYETEQPIPTETNRVSRRLRLDTELVNSVLQEFFFHTENGWINARCDAEIEAYRTKADTARLNGKLGGRPKKTQSVILANPAETGSKANQEPITNNQEPLTKSRAAPATRLPDDWMPSESDIEFCKTTRPDLDVYEVADSFRDYWTGVAGSKGKKINWPGTWRNWVRSPYQKPPPTKGYESEKDRSRREFAQAIFGKAQHEPANERDITGTSQRVD